MTGDDPERELQRLHEAGERISSNLVELEIDSSRQMLDASPLTGQTAAKWSRASGVLTELWRQNGLLEGWLERADKLRGFRRSEQLRSQIGSPSIEVGGAMVPLAQRRLTGSSQIVERCTPDELISTMSASFDEVKEVVARIGDAWQALIPKIDVGRRLLQESRALAERAPGADRRQLEALSTEVEHVGAAITADPLSVQPGEVDDLVQAITALRDELDAGLAFQRGFEARILAARELLEQLRTTQQEARAAHEELVVKIEAPGIPRGADADDDLERELSEIADLADCGAWEEARHAMTRWTARANTLLDAARQAVAANRAPIEARNQFRALLEAYRVKAKRLGRLEDADLAGIFARAQDVLYTAPTNLAEAAQLVRSYQQALSVDQPTPEAMR
jgi:hypothetical protein